MKKIFVSMLVFIVAFSMLNEGLQAGVISSVSIQEGCDSVTISWYVSQYTDHTNVHWISGKSGYSSVRTGSGYFSQTFSNLSSGYYSFKIHARISGQNYYSGTKSFRISGCSSSSTPSNSTATPSPPSIDAISDVRIQKSCNKVTISWYVSGYTDHTNVHWISGKSGYSSVRTGSGYFSQTFNVSSGYYSFKIHARISGQNYYSGTRSFWFVRTC